MKKHFIFLFSLLLLALASERRMIVSINGEKYPFTVSEIDSIYFENAELFNPDILVVESDYNNGLLSVINENGEYQKGISIDADSYVKAINGNIYVLERMKSSIIKLNAFGTIEYQTHIKDSWNAHDLVVVDENLGYICSNSFDEIAEFNPTTGEITKFFSLSIDEYGDGEKTLNPTRMVLKGNQVVIACQMRSGWTPVAPAKILLMTVGSGSIDTWMTCNYMNPTDIELIDDTLYVANMGNWESVDGALEKVNLKTGEAEVVLSGANLNADIESFALNLDSKTVYTTLYRGWGDAPLLKFDLLTKTAIDTVEGIVQATDPVFSSAKDLLFVGDRSSTGTNSIRIIGTSEDVVLDTIETTYSPIFIDVR